MAKKITANLSAPLTELSLKELLDVWYPAWQSSGRKTLWPRAANDALRDVGSSARDLQERINDVLVKAKRSVKDERQVRRYLDARMEMEQALVEDVSNNPIGQIFMLKAKHGYEDKQTIKMEGGNLSDIIAANSTHAKVEDAE